MCSSCLPVQFQVICIQFTSNITLFKQFPNVIYVNHEQQRPEAASLNYSTNYFLCIWLGVAHPYTLRTYAEEIWNPGQQVAIYSLSPVASHDI